MATAVAIASPIATRWSRGPLNGLRCEVAVSAGSGAAVRSDATECAGLLRCLVNAMLPCTGTKSFALDGPAACDSVPGVESAANTPKKTNNTQNKNPTNNTNKQREP